VAAGEEDRVVALRWNSKRFRFYCDGIMGERRRERERSSEQKRGESVADNGR
jgi:hypothetical protein